MSFARFLAAVAVSSARSGGMLGGLAPAAVKADRAEIKATSQRIAARAPAAPAASSQDWSDVKAGKAPRKDVTWTFLLKTTFNP